jgi:hypothetical protein
MVGNGPKTEAPPVERLIYFARLQLAFFTQGQRQFKNETHQPQELTKKGSSGTV